MGNERRDLLIQVCAVISLLCLLIYFTQIHHFHGRHLWIVGAVGFLVVAMTLRWGGFFRPK